MLNLNKKTNILPQKNSIISQYAKAVSESDRKQPPEGKYFIPGHYIVEIESVTIFESPNKMNPRHYFKMECVAQDTDQDEIAIGEKLVWVFGMHQFFAEKYLLQFMAGVLGYDPDDANNLKYQLAADGAIGADSIYKTFEDLFEAVFGKEQLFSGRKVGVCVEQKIAQKSKKPFNVFTFSPVDEEQNGG